MPQWIRIATCYSARDAQLLGTYLRAHGVPVETSNEHFINAVPVYTLATGGIDLWVGGRDAHQCAELMAIWLEKPEDPPRITLRWVIAVLLSFWAFFMVGVSYGWPPPPRSSIFAVAPQIIRQSGGEEEKNGIEGDEDERS